MRVLTFSGRTLKEILRDPLNLFFGLAFPLVIIGLLTLIQSNIPTPMFELNKLTPGVTVFGLSFMTLFSATLVAKDRESAFLQRLYTTPLTSVDFVLGYALPILPISVLQAVICYLFSIILGLDVGINLIYALVCVLPIACFYVVLGLLCGSLLNVKQVGGICGALLTNLSAWFSGVWFDIDLVGGTFKKIAGFLPFVHAVELEKAVFNGRFDEILPHVLWVFAYTALIGTLAIFCFLKQMRNSK